MLRAWRVPSLASSYRVSVVNVKCSGKGTGISANRALVDIQHRLAGKAERKRPEGLQRCRWVEILIESRQIDDGVIEIWGRDLRQGVLHVRVDSDEVGFNALGSEQRLQQLACALQSPYRTARTADAGCDVQPPSSKPTPT